MGNYKNTSGEFRGQKIIFIYKTKAFKNVIHGNVIM